jgi:CheY-like chemotaxis protein
VNGRTPLELAMAKTILVVDDDPGFLGRIEPALRKGGYEVLRADSALKGLALLEESIPDAIVLDIMMEERNGLGFLENLRWEARFDPIPVIVLGGATLSREEREFVEACTVAWLDKTQPQRLPETLKAILPPP